MCSPKCIEIKTFISVLTQHILHGELHFQLLWIQYGAGRLVTQYQVWRDLRDGQSTAGVLWVDQQTILQTNNQSVQYRVCTIFIHQVINKGFVFLNVSRMDRDLH